MPPAVDWHRHWYPVAPLADLDRRRPQPFTLLEQDLVLWWEEAAQQWRAFADVCPHRLVPLSDGRINARGELECPYHGWSFEGSGRCTLIPQAESDAALASRRSTCRTYATAEAQGLLFVFAGDPNEAAAVPLPLVPALEEPGEPWLVQDTFRDLPMDALTLLENVLDVSHVPFTHHKTVGNRATAAPVRAELTSFSEEGFTGLWPEGPRKGSLGSQHTTFAAPALMWHELDAKAFARILTVVYAVPIRRGECRLLARFPFRFRSPWPARLLGLRPRWLQHISNHRVLEDDQLFLHWQERVLETRGRSGSASRAYNLATGADLYIKALHDWVSRFSADPFPDQALPPRLERDALMERFHAHTEHCQSCGGALAGIRRWRPWLPLPLWGSLAAIAWFHTLPALVAGGTVALASALADRQLGRWEQGLLRGTGEPPRNRL
ncbi:Rieske 2Fe-2S domain-containing protein [Synechococcus sp. CCY9201]|uniref:aromatic ring-hydroxylating dioxygenase subunit alpha n=1 Tax=Synechococcus sp. CCY9201 TaxID=174697 RepID=UPI002B206AA8|nr:Rieske 2Fe-2S domain-containing protein [Synechococcus sp. CCY9201]MEA5473964.1 Rieske 2Fe-2S domain-containing protein [Synechococcus sp. CCY9201]